MPQHEERKHPGVLLGGRVAAVSSLALSLSISLLPPWGTHPAGNPGSFFLPSIPHPMPGLTAGLGRRGLTGRTQAAGDSIYSLWSWGREKKKGKGWALSVFYPLPPIARGFVPWEGPGSTRHSVLEGAERCRETAGRAGLQGEEQKRPVSLVYVG